MESDGFHQVEHIEEMGQCANWSQSMLHQICPKSRTGADAWYGRRSKGVYFAMLYAAVTLTKMIKATGTK